MFPLNTIVRSVASLSANERSEMHQLMAAHYEEVTAVRFNDDLSRKDEVILLLDAASLIRGFTTIAWNPSGLLTEGDILFSGDTIIDRACWGTQELVRAFCRRAGEWRRIHGRRLFWFLISKGHRTYLYLPLFARRFYPHPNHAEPAMGALASEVAAALFGDAWKCNEGVIRFSKSQGHLREELAAERGCNPWVRFFEEKNPGHACGEELVCITEMVEDNLRRVALQAFKQGMEDRT